MSKFITRLSPPSLNANANVNVNANLYIFDNLYYIII